MTDLNERIRAALRADDQEALAEFASEPDLFEQVLETFRGRSRMIVFIAMAVGIMLMTAAVTCAICFFDADPSSTRSLIAWSMGFLFCLAAILGMKVWYWMELQKNAITREIKRLEIQITRLADRA